MSKQRFRTTPIRKSGGGASIVVPFDPNEAWGSKAKHYITGSVGGCGIRGTVEPEGDGFAVSLGPVWVRDSGLPEGEVEVELYPEGPQVDLLAEDIRAAFAEAPEARAFFESLATFYRKGFIDPIESAKRPATRTAKIAEMIELLKAGKRQK